MDTLVWKGLNTISEISSKTTEEREFYLKLAKNEKYSFRELERQITAGIFERTVIGNLKVSTALRETYPEINSFKDSYVFEFLNLSRHNR